MTEAVPQRLLLVGAGGHGRVVADLAETCGWDDIAFVDDEWPELDRNSDWPVLGTLADLGHLPEHYPYALSALGDNELRLRSLATLVELGFTVPALIHPTAVVSKRAAVGAGTVAMANAVVNAATRVGQGVILNTGCTVDHDCVIGDGVHVAPGAHIAGEVAVGRSSWIGIGASVRGGASIGCRATIGAGAAVVTDVPDDAVYAGVPAAPLKAPRHGC